jgi:hypothetical protein
MLSEGRTRESPLQFPRWIVDGSENGGWSRPDCRSPAPVAGVFIEKDTGGTTLLRPYRKSTGVLTEEHLWWRARSPVPN